MHRTTFLKKERGLAIQSEEQARSTIIDTLPTSNREKNHSSTPHARHRAARSIETFSTHSTGAQVKIPSILVSHYEGDKLIDAARKADEDGESVVVKLAWDIPQSNQVFNSSCIIAQVTFDPTHFWGGGTTLCLVKKNL